MSVAPSAPSRRASARERRAATRSGRSCGAGFDSSQATIRALQGNSDLAASVADEYSSGRTRLAIGTIGNVEHAGAGDVQEVRSLQAGGVVRGRGRIGGWTGLHLAVPASRQIQERVEIMFSNGWSLRANGDSLELWDARGIVHIFR